MNPISRRYLIYSIFFFMLMLSNSCSSDDESAVSREDYLGTYMIAETCGSTESDYLITITTGSQSDEININNFYGVGAEIVAQVEEDSLTIDPQMITTFGLNQTFEGSGALIGDELRLYYSVETPNVDIDDCTAIGQKQ
ncbi:MAG: hypothetical protein AB8F74_12820 [Saprospiraceae bacterium]